MHDEQQSVDSGGTPASSDTGLARFAATGCDDALWARVYNPTRLQRVSPCITVTGTIAESAADPDGDQHFLLKLDPGQEILVNQVNVRKKNGDLVVEIVCANPVSLPKVGSTCQGVKNRIAIPEVGARVRATGSYVIDSHNGWAEVHPVSTLRRF